MSKKRRIVLKIEFYIIIKIDWRGLLWSNDTVEVFGVKINLLDLNLKIMNL
jgi:hypothetical protein